MADALARGGARVVATLDGRSERTARLAADAPFELLPDLVAVVREADVVLSIVPPEAAPSVARDIARAAGEQGTAPLLADLNAISPATARELALAGLEVVDGSISGPPPWKARHDAGLPLRAPCGGGRGAPVRRRRLLSSSADEVGSASAVKMSTASVYKGTSALLLQALTAAHENGVLEHVLADLRAGAPSSSRNVERRLAVADDEGAPVRRRDARDRRDAAGGGSHAGAVRRDGRGVRAELARTPLATRDPGGRRAPELSLRDVLARLRPEASTGSG